MQSLTFRQEKHEKHCIDRLDGRALKTELTAFINVGNKDLVCIVLLMNPSFEMVFGWCCESPVAEGGESSCNLSLR